MFYFFSSQDPLNELKNSQDSDDLSDTEVRGHQLRKLTDKRLAEIYNFLKINIVLFWSEWLKDMSFFLLLHSLSLSFNHFLFNQMYYLWFKKSTQAELSASKENLSEVTNKKVTKWLSYSF